MKIGYLLSSEEHGPATLVRFARDAEQRGFKDLMISDHFHPWNEEQGQSPFVWTVIGGIASTTAMSITTGVTCPTTRIHPVIVAQAAATSQLLAEGRFRLGVGTGENLNEHITGEVWPPASVRRDMLEEAVAVMRELWKGDVITMATKNYTVHNARLYSLPQTPPPVLVSGFGEHSVRMAATMADGYVTAGPDAESLELYRRHGGRGPAVASMKVCVSGSAEEGLRIAHRLWRTSGVPGEAAQELPMPRHFEEAAELVTEEMVGKKVVTGPDPAPYVEMIARYRDAGYDELFISQIGSDQKAFFDLYEREIAPLLRPRDMVHSG